MQNCEICSSPLSEPIPELFGLPSVTSDCRPWTAGRSVTVCSGCGVMKRVTNEEFSKDIYADYKIFEQALGADQINFSGVPEGRTSKILKFISPIAPEPKFILDIGSGSGAGLYALAKHFPQSAIFGYEPYSKNFRVACENVTILPERPIDRKFDLITLFHVFEHIEDTHEMLTYIKSVLNPDGQVLIQVPYTLMWPFDLVIADHVWYFTMCGLTELITKEGFNVLNCNNGVIKKEITLLAKIGKPDYTIGKSNIESRQSQCVIDWLLRYKSFLDSITEPKIAIYGSCPAAAWAGSILGDKVSMYLDDDQCRLGAMFNGKPIATPEWVDSGMPVIAPFPDWQMEEIKEKNPKLRFLDMNCQKQENKA